MNLMKKTQKIESIQKCDAKETIQKYASYKKIISEAALESEDNNNSGYSDPDTEDYVDQTGNIIVDAFKHPTAESPNSQTNGPFSLPRLNGHQGKCST